MAIDDKETTVHDLDRTTTNDVDDLKVSDVHQEDVAIARLTDEDLFRLSKESFKFRSRAGLRIMLIMFVQGCNQAGYGVDWQVITGINNYPSWHTYFNFGTSGSTYGTLNALMNVGTMCGAPFLTFSDHIGRRGINFTGNAFVILAAILQGCATNMPMFMVGRFILGFGSAIMSSPQYMAEVSPAHYRGRLVGLFGACFQVGSLAMTAGLIGFTKMQDDNNLAWRIPLLLEALFPAIVCLTIYFWTPESPRFYVLKGKIAQARRVVARYQTNSDDEHSELVNAVIAQIEDSIEQDRVINRQWWNFFVFFTKPVRYRLLVLVLYSIFQQWNGGGIITTYLVPALDTVGITNKTSIAGINFGLTAIYCVFTVAGSFLIDMVNRRTLIFAGLISFVVLQTAATITGWRYSVDPTTAAAALTLLWIFSFQICSATLIATMHNLYPVECLSLVLRAKGMGFFSLIQGIAGTVQNYGISLGIGPLGYKIWAVYVGYNLLQLVLSYFVFPETANLSLEEIDAVFETKGVNPVPMSLNIQKAKKETQRLNAERDENII
ncbi:hypothetical protein V495_05708 [Pseudogymnoascus sp. VKM F-4514 (FW-929)]|nr:hypothetical protein V490_01772 [Pseudogymnoascus sp. VKM F-3557]KFY39886.1 hypothetical protein V495_05708 [Pseudogymnoascus sp. VKM F-4514 (FW-929)]KFY57764.1 hypothetical protein V497_05292 [Pseudogymnoascus sp. VKM F-4516 (FW-969)]